MNIKKLFRRPKPPTYFNFIDRMVSKGYKLDVVYDIGAFKGEWATTLKKKYPRTEVILFEGNIAHETVLRSRNLKFFNVVLSSPERTSVDYYNGADSGDSYYKETTTHYDSKGYINTPCVTLDEMVSNNKLNLPNFIKLDTQGSELDILAGSKIALNAADFVYVECPIINYNSGAPNISDYLQFFRGAEFIPVDIYEIHRSEYVLLQIDIMFLKLSAKERFLGPLKHIRPLE